MVILRQIEKKDQGVLHGSLQLCNNYLETDMASNSDPVKFSVGQSLLQLNMVQSYSFQYD